MGANVDTSGVGGDLAHARERTGFALGGAGTMASAELAHGVTPCEDATRPHAITLDHLWSIACSSGSRPPVSDACVIENQRAGRDASHHSIVGSAFVIAWRYYTRWPCGPVSAVGAAHEGMEGTGDRCQRPL